MGRSVVEFEMSLTAVDGREDGAVTDMFVAPFGVEVSLAFAGACDQKHPLADQLRLFTHTLRLPESRWRSNFLKNSASFCSRSVAVQGRTPSGNVVTTSEGTSRRKRDTTTGRMAPK